MVFYKFRTFTTSYYFPIMGKELQFMYGLYSAYGGFLSRCYWWLFMNFSIIRKVTQVDERHLPFPYQYIKSMDGSDCVMAFNIGSPGVEQKISILGYDRQKCMPFFAKFSQKKQAKQLTEHEASIYEKLKGTGLTPELLQLTKWDDSIYMKAEYIEGARPADMMINKHILDLTVQLGNYHLGTTGKNAEGLNTCLSHGDFCPWNILVDNDRYRLIDWELADERPLGYDLLTYICNVSALFEPTTPLLDAVKKQERWLMQYFSAFDIEDYTPYLRAFVDEKANYEQSKGDTSLARLYHSFKLSVSRFR